jgi:hypothetical protein
MIAEEYVDQWCQGRGNFITPERLEVEWLVEGQSAYELSYGEPFGERMWGVTVVEGRQRSDRSRPFFSKSEARDYINGLVIGDRK